MDGILDMLDARPVKTILLLATLCLYLLASACSESNEQTTGVINEDSIALQAPRRIRQSRIAPEDLKLTVILGGNELVMVQEGDRWTTSTTVPYGQSVEISVEWSFAGATLATWNDSIPEVTKNLSLTVLDREYTYDYDDDGDGVTNLDELGVLTSDGEDPGSISDEVAIRYYAYVEAFDKPLSNLTTANAIFLRFSEDPLISQIEKPERR